MRSLHEQKNQSRYARHYRLTGAFRPAHTNYRWPIYLLRNAGGDSLVQKYEGTDPAAALDDLTLKAILADELAGADYKSTAANILAWQDATMKYADPGTQADASYAMRWNYILPGIFPVSDIVEERVDAVDGMIYGVCWDYAIDSNYELVTWDEGAAFR